MIHVGLLTAFVSLGFQKVVTIEELSQHHPLLDMVDHNRRPTAPVSPPPSQCRLYMEGLAFNEEQGRKEHLWSSRLWSFWYIYLCGTKQSFCLSFFFSKNLDWLVVLFAAWNQLDWFEVHLTVFTCISFFLHFVLFLQLSPLEDLPQIQGKSMIFRFNLSPHFTSDS